MSPTTAPRDEANDHAFSCDARALDETCTLVTATGELDVYTSPEFQRVLDDARRARPLLVIDLSDVSFMDSTALGVLVVLQRETGRPLDIVVAQEHLRTLLEITGLHTVFTLHPSLEDAQAQVKAA